MERPSKRQLYLWALIAAVGLNLALLAYAEYIKAHKYSTDSMIDAAIEGDINILRAQLRAGINPDEEEYARHDTALAQAAIARRYESVKVLLAFGADANKPAGPNLAPPLCWAIRGGDSRIVKLLLEHGADPNTYDTYGDPTLFRAVTGDSAWARLLLEAGADPLIKDRNGTSALQLAREKGFKETQAVMESYLRKRSGSNQPGVGLKNHSRRSKTE